MDKLEIDDRLARLERRVSTLTTLLTAVLLLPGAAALLYFLMPIGANYEPPTATPVATPAPPPMPDVHAGFTDNMGSFEADFRKARALMTEGIIKAEDFAAKKALILAKPLQVIDFSEDLRAARKLVSDGILTEPEFEELKKKILGTGP